jgi:hypothetical protein
LKARKIDELIFFLAFPNTGGISVSRYTLIRQRTIPRVRLQELLLGDVDPVDRDPQDRGHKDRDYFMKIL